MVKAIGTAARVELERELDRRVHLDLHVKVKADWRDNERLLDEIAAQNRESGRPTGHQRQGPRTRSHTGDVCIPPRTGIVTAGPCRIARDQIAWPTPVARYA